MNALSQNVAESHAAHSNVPTDVRIYFKIQIILKVLTFLALMNTTGVLYIFKSLHAMLLITINGLNCILGMHIKRKFIIIKNYQGNKFLSSTLAFERIFVWQLNEQNNVCHIYIRCHFA